MSEKQRISASVDETLKEQLDAKENINKSALINSLLREYLAHGESTSVALKIRREELRKEKQNAELRKQSIENEIESLENKIEELTDKIQQRRSDALKGIDDIVEKVENEEMTTNFINENNPLIKQKASEAGVPPREFAQEVMEALDGEQ